MAGFGQKAIDIDIMDIINTAHAGVISDAPTFSKIGGNVLTLLLSIFAVIAIIMLVVYGIMYLTAYGDEEQIKKAKSGSLWAVVGIISALGGMALVSTIGKFFQ